MKFWKRISAALCAALLTCSMAGCKNNTQGNQNTETQVPETEMLSIVKNGESKNYRIVYSQNAGAVTQAAAIKLRGLIGDATGVYPEPVSDFEREGTSFVRTDFEILLGETTRPESVALESCYQKSKDFGIFQTGTKVAIVSGNESGLDGAVSVFASRYIDADTKSVSVPMGEQYESHYAYAVGNLTIDGTSIQNFTLIASASQNEAATLLQDAIEQQVGYRLSLKAKSSETVTHKIVFSDESNDSIGMLESRWSCSDGTVTFEHGSLTSAVGAVQSFSNSYLAKTAESIEVMRASGKTVSAETDHLFLANVDYLNRLDKRAETMKNGILNSSPDLSHVTGQKYYVSPEGSDSADGKTPQSAWRTLDKVNSASLRGGDAILFERGGMWRGNIEAKYDVTYSSFGVGEMPIINGSKQNYADANIWKETDIKNVWKCTETFNNVGVIAFDHSGTVGDYNQKTGQILFHRDNAFLNQRDLDTDLQFYCNLSDGSLYLYSAEGNPGERFRSIEIGENQSLIWLSGSGNTVDGLRFMYTGGCAIAGGDSTYITVRNCIIEWVGGSVLSNTDNRCLYGNAIQIYGQTRHFTAENNWCYQIYDTGITFQYSSRGAGSCIYEDIAIRKNLVEYCHWSIEYYNQKKDGTIRTTTNVDISENFCRFGGMGWGTEYRYKMYPESLTRQASAALLCSWGLTDETTQFTIKDNYFDRCTGYLGLVNLLKGGDEKVQFSGNVFVQYTDQPFATLFGTLYGTNTAGVASKDIMKDVNATVAYVEKTESESED